MNLTRHLFPVATSAILTLLVSIPASAGVAFSRLAIRQNSLLLSLESDSTNSVNIERVVNDGLSLKVVYTLTLFKKRSFLNPDMAVTNFQLVYLSKKDVINKGYETEVHFGSDSRGRWFSTTAELVPFLMSARDLRVLRLSLLEPQTVYSIEVRQEITSLDIQPPLSFIYSLFGSWNYISGRVRSRPFTRNGILNE